MRTVISFAFRRLGRRGLCLFHAPSGGIIPLRQIDGDLFLLVTGEDGDAERLIAAISRNYSTDELAAAFQRHQILTDHLEATTTPPPPREEPAPVKGELLMHGNLICNMNCSYCNSREARAEADAGRAPRVMPLETAKRSVRFIAERMAGKGEHAYVNFTLGGEPLLSFDRYRLLRDHCAEVSEETGVPITMNINTNGVSFTEEFFKYCEGSNVCAAVSIDGPRDIHDPMRPFPSGKGTYDAIAKSLPRALGSECPGLNNAAAGAVITALNPYPKRVAEHLIGLGFRHVVMTPVRDYPDREWSLNGDTVEGFRKGYSEYAEWVLDLLAKGDDRVYAVLIEHDFFARYLIRLIRRTKQPYRCEAGRTTFGVSVDGGLYPCDSFIRMKEYRLGDVFDGIDAGKQAEFMKDTMIDEKPVCRDCRARYQCGGGCYYTAALVNGDHRIPHEAKCDLIRHCVELAIWILAELRERNPDALQRLWTNVPRAASYDISPGVNA